MCFCRQPKRYNATTTIKELIGEQSKGTTGSAETSAEPFPKLSKDDLKAITDSLKLTQELTTRKECDEALNAFGIPSLGALISGLTPNNNLFDGRNSTLTGPIGDKGKSNQLPTISKRRKKQWCCGFWKHITGRGSVTFLGNYFFNPTRI
jgi:hypothetical protein